MKILSWLQCPASPSALLILLRNREILDQDEADLLTEAIDIGYSVRGVHSLRSDHEQACELPCSCLANMVSRNSILLSAGGEVRDRQSFGSRHRALAPPVPGITTSINRASQPNGSVAV